MSQPLPQSGLTGTSKLKAVSELMRLLTADLASSTHMPSQQRDAALEELKVYGRDPRNADPIFTKEGIETLTKHAFNSSSTITSRNALRCLANALLIKPETRQIFVDLGYAPKACNKLKSANLDTEFLLSRIIFLTTYGTNVQLQTLIDQHHLADAIVQNLARHAKLSGKSANNSSSMIAGAGAGSSLVAKAKGKETSKADPMADMALTETAKLLFNVTHFCQDRVDAFTPAIAPIVTMICKHDTPQPKPLEAPVSSLVNALLTLNLAGKEGSAALFPAKGETTMLADRLVQLLDLALQNYSDTELDQAVLPLVTALRKIYELAPADKVRPALRAGLLPKAADRKKVLGWGDTLAAKLLRHMTNALAPDFRNAVAHMLFELSDKDATKFVQNVGYGFASGFLFQNNVPMPEGATEAFQAAAAADGDNKRVINAITGQFIDEETEPDLPEMTDEEKEREAERLFVLFERLRRTGIVNVENPVATALREGRFQQIDDDKRVEELD
ncbi:hypothetical protein CMQ_889 [Grosmannia clavigera kw1407]|uniref:Guanine nucleotide exchange factor n=1 Tax=Grosmannia clavigera (strain kw1407 / UAMH 11150) TaxID=655863 RepID=F0XDI5_GROCL|nr:uncharacterized protein CMQ_889 [Grosmannia clavigera kw1407]EFX03961.1 hypothetical protein CMQ_889 [Grosmannia clavigera kw1407]